MTVENTDPAQAAKAPAPRRAGKLQGKVDAEFHTGEALVLVDGRNPDPKTGKKRIYGLKAFAKRAGMIMSSSDRGDPFADYCLAMIHNRLDEIQKSLPEESRKLRALADARLDPGIRASKRVAYQSTTWSVSPVEESFNFGHYASRALFSLVQFDEFVMLAKELNHHDVITHDECYRHITNAGHRIRGLLSLGSNYTYTQCTREHLRTRTAVARKAVEKLAETGFIDMKIYNGFEDVCDTFALHEPAPHLAPSRTEADGTGADESASAQNGAGDTPDADAGEKSPDPAGKDKTNTNT